MRPAMSTTGCSRRAAIHPDSADPSQMARIFVRDLVLPVRIGAYSHERDAPQKVRFDVSVDVPPPARRDAGDGAGLFLRPHHRRDRSASSPRSTSISSRRLPSGSAREVLRDPRAGARDGEGGEARDRPGRRRRRADDGPLRRRRAKRTRSSPCSTTADGRRVEADGRQGRRQLCAIFQARRCRRAPWSRAPGAR